MICYTPAEVAARWKCSATLVRKMIDNGELSAFRAGGKLLRVREADLLEYERRTATNAKVTAEPAPAQPEAASASVVGLDAAIRQERQRKLSRSPRRKSGA